MGTLKVDLPRRIEMYEVTNPSPQADSDGADHDGLSNV